MYSFNMRHFLFLWLISPLIANANSDIYARGEEFLKWAQTNEAFFAQCLPTKEKGDYVLCDQTRISESEIKTLFKKKPAQLVEFMRSKNIKLDIICGKSTKNLFQNWCSSESSSKSLLKDISSLHGQYMPSENKIVIQSTAYKGSFIHEYLHYLQSQNQNLVFQKKYKSERNDIQKKIESEFNRIISESTELQKDPVKNKEALKGLIGQATKLSDLLMKMGFYQKIIDERNLFQLYIKYGAEIGIESEDIALAKKNIGFLCQSKDVKDILPETECKETESLLVNTLKKYIGEETLEISFKDPKEFFATTYCYFNYQGLVDTKELTPELFEKFVKGGSLQIQFWKDYQKWLKTKDGQSCAKIVGQAKGIAIQKKHKYAILLNEKAILGEMKPYAFERTLNHERLHIIFSKYKNKQINILNKWNTLTIKEQDQFKQYHKGYNFEDLDILMREYLSYSYEGDPLGAEELMGLN